MRYGNPFAIGLTCLIATIAPRWCFGDADDVQENESRRIAAIAKAQPSVLAVFSADGGGGGSGVIISEDGFALSNFHVTKPSGDAMKCGLPDGTYEDAVIVGLDPTGDVALIKLLGRDNYPAATLGDSDLVQAGEWVFAMGNPFLLATDFQPTVTYGIISGTHRYQYPAGTFLEYADCLQTDASINPGNSGGPLFNSAGELIGINGRGSFEKRGRVNVGVAYAISINQIKNFLGDLHSGRVVDHATLGARVGSGPDGEVLVTEIFDDSDAYRRGLRYGDEIISFAGRPIRSVNVFKNTLGIFPEGWRVPLEYRRRGRTEQILVRLTGVHTDTELTQAVTGSAVPDPNKPPGDEEEKPAPPKHEDGQSDPEDGNADKDDHERPAEQPRQRLRKMGQEPVEMPEVAKRQFESRPGYANFYFNKLNQQRVLKALLAQGDFRGLLGPWHFKGELLTAGDAEFELRQDSVKTVLPGGPLAMTVTENLSSARDPVDSGGLLAALHLWRRLLTQGSAGFDEFHYQGKSPLPSASGLVDVIVATAAGVDCRFYVDVQAGRLLAMEMSSGIDEDPCEVYFSGFNDIGGHILPNEMEVRYGNDLYGLFHFTEFKLLPAER